MNKCPSAMKDTTRHPSSYMISSLTVDGAAPHPAWPTPIRLMVATLVHMAGSVLSLQSFLDCGATVSAISTALARRLGLTLAPYEGPRLRAADGRAVQPRHQAFLPHVDLPGCVERNLNLVCF